MGNKASTSNHWNGSTQDSPGKYNISSNSNKYKWCAISGENDIISFFIFDD